MSKDTIFGWKIVGLFIVAAVIVFKVVLPWWDRRQSLMATAASQGVTPETIDWTSGTEAP